MATTDQDERKVSFEWLKKFGMKWAVLAALVIDLGKRGIRVPSEVNEQLKLARMKIMSGCFSPCEVGCALGKLEGSIAGRDGHVDAVDVTDSRFKDGLLAGPGYC